MTSDEDEENGTNVKIPDLLVTSENTDFLDSDQSILPEGDSKEKGDQCGERCSATYTNNQTEMSIPNPEGTLRLFLFHKNKVQLYTNIRILFVCFLNLSLKDSMRLKELFFLLM